VYIKYENQKPPHRKKRKKQALCVCVFKQIAKKLHELIGFVSQILEKEAEMR
jgi:hypothetical protein